jgi:hypothetical protein
MGGVRNGRRSSAEPRHRALFTGAWSSIRCGKRHSKMWMHRRCQARISLLNTSHYFLLTLAEHGIADIARNRTLKYVYNHSNRCQHHSGPERYKCARSGCDYLLLSCYKALSPFVVKFETYRPTSETSGTCIFWGWRIFRRKQQLILSHTTSYLVFTASRSSRGTA